MKENTAKDAEQDPAENGDQAPPPAASGTPQGFPGISPPGMTLRSRRKKRRRGSTDASTDDEGEKPPSKRRASSRKNKVTTGIASSDDETMTDGQEAEDDVTVEDGKPEAANGHKPHAFPTVLEVEETHEGTTAIERTAEAASTNGTAKPALEPISKLRMPSKHTPGKLQTTAPAAAAASGRVESRRLQFGVPTNVLNEPPPRKAAAAASAPTEASKTPQPPPVASPEGIPTAELASILAEGTRAQEKETVQEAAVISWYQSASTSLISMVYNVREVAVTMIVPQTEEYAEGEEEAMIGLPVQSPILTRPYVWFIILLFVQLLFWPFILTTVQETSDRSLHFYESMFAPKEPSIDMRTTEDSVLGNLPVEELDDVDNQTLKSIQIYTELLEPFRMSSDLESHIEFAEKQLREIRGRMRERRVSLDDWHEAFTDVESSLKYLAEAQGYEKVPELFVRANEMLGFFRDMVPPEIHTELLDVQYVFLWQPLPPTCNTTDSPASEGALFTPEQLDTGEKELRQLARSSASKLKTDVELSSDLKSWIRDALNAISRSEQEAKLLVGPSKTHVQKVIDDVLEVKQADQTGIPDWASISAGAVVIRSGKRATSPSLIHSLPLWNRLMKQAHLRFYGYGPEAALTPTWPTNALGQCWAFEKASKQNEGSYGRYATLTIRLGRPIHVTSVAVEHAPSELTDQLQSAIQDFRILGFEDASGAGEPWHLGSFRYDVDAPRTFQEFEVATRIEDEPTPKFRSVTLAIDSNWGFPYSCLYRFRVHGKDEQSDRVRVDDYDGDIDDDGVDDEYDSDIDDEYDGDI